MDFNYANSMRIFKIQGKKNRTLSYLFVKSLFGLKYMDN